MTTNLRLSDSGGRAEDNGGHLDQFRLPRLLSVDNHMKYFACCRPHEI
jgi:hypothetical protein